MPGSTYSTNLKVELMATGENSGTWGDITNTNLGTALEQAIVGYGNPDYASDANLTISITNSNAAQAARALVLNVTSSLSLTATRELVVPTIQKQYIVQNNTTGSQSITVKTSAGTGITVPNGRKAHLYVNGTDVIQMFDFVDINGGAIDGTPIGASSASTGAFTTLNASGATTLDGNVTLGNASGDNVTVTGTITSNLLFTDNTYDIGASGATRPRNLFLAGAATVGGNLSVGGTLTLTGGVNLNGNVTVGDSSSDTLTINSTITSNLIFTDNTYDIGASGATRPRNLFLAGNATIGGNQTLTGSLTVDSTTDSSSTTTGSIQTDGGLGVAKALYVGTTANIGGNVGINVAPSPWGGTDTRAMDILAYFGVFANTTGNGTMGLAFNTYYDAGSYLLKVGSAYSGTYEYSAGTGQHTWKVAPLGGAAGSAAALTRAMTLTATGYVGIRTTSPDGFLHVAPGSAAAASTAGAPIILQAQTGGSSASGGNILIGSGQNGSGGSNGYIAFGIGSSTSGSAFASGEAVRITSAGLVGINTTSPGARLEVVTASAASTPAAIFRSPAGVGNSGGLALYTSDTNANARNWYLVANTSAYGDFSIRQSNALAGDPAAAGTDRLYIGNTGNVGVGTTSPAYKVDTTVNTDGINGYNVYGAQGGASEQIGYRALNANSTGIFVGVNGFNYSGGLGSANLALLTTLGNVALVLGTNSTERARITNGGILSIGDTNPSTNYLLYVNGASFAKCFFATAYTGDGLFSANARPSVINTPSGGTLRFGYQDDGGGQYNPAIGFRAPGTLGTGQTDYSNAIYATTNGALAFSTSTGGSYAERVRLTNDGLLGVGMSPNLTQLDVRQNTTYAFGINNSGGTRNYSWRIDSGTDALVLGTRTTSTDLVTVTTGGDLLVGTSSSSGRLTVVTGAGSQAALFTSGSGTTQQAIATFSNITNSGYLSIAGVGTTSSVGTWTNGSMVTEAVPNGSGNFFLGAYTGDLVFQNNRVNSGRFTSAGNFVVGADTASGGTQRGWVFLRNWFGAGDDALIIGHASAASGDPYMAFNYNGSAIGTITQNGTTAVAYNTSSDYRLKNVTGPVTTSGAYIDSLKPVEGTWKSDGSTFVGLIAHEVQEVSRTQIATGVKDGERMQGMDYSNSEFIANIIAELQSLRKRVAQLEQGV